MDRCINVISGMTGSGKSWLLEKILSLPQHKTAVLVRMDEIGKRFWGDRWITKTERVYRNELTRNEIKTLLIVYGAKTLFLEAPMLTRKNHQEPFVAMIRSAEKYLQAIETDMAEKESTPPPTLTHVHLNVILLYCDLETAAARIEKRDSATDATNTNVFSFDGFLETAVQFELPESKTYIPLPINTARMRETEIVKEAVEFFRGKYFPRRVVETRLKEAERYLIQGKELAKSRGIKAGSV